MPNADDQFRDPLKPEQPPRQGEAALRNALGFTESIVDTVREPLLVLDAKLHVIIASRAFYQTFGVTREATEGRFLYDLGNGQWNIPALRTRLEEVLPAENSFEDFEVTHNFPDLGRRVMLLNARRIWREGNHTEQVLLAIEDITERKRLEKDLLQSNDDLQRFAYIAAHDLRSPLHSALSLSQMLARHLHAKLDEKELQMLSLMTASLERLGSLMHDILTYSEMNLAPRPLTLMPLQEPLDIALANLQHHIAESGANITVSALPEVRCDRTQLVMVLQNLIGNAIKYRREEPLRIRIESAREENHWRISISDNGQGFESSYAVQIFEPFKRLHGGDVPGSGIGLATCKRVVESLDGRIWAESTPGTGSVFYFTLPFGQNR